MVAIGVLNTLSAQAASKAAIQADLELSSIPAIKAITAVARQRCRGCFLIRIEGRAPVEEAYEVIQIEGTNIGASEAKIVQQSR